MRKPIQHLEGSWNAYQARFVAPDTPSDQVEDQRLAFYAGVDSLVRLMALHLGNGDPLGYSSSEMFFMTGIASEIAHYLKERLALGEGQAMEGVEAS